MKENRRVLFEGLEDDDIKESGSEKEKDWSFEFSEDNEMDEKLEKIEKMVENLEKTVKSIDKKIDVMLKIIKSEEK